MQKGFALEFATYPGWYAMAFEIISPFIYKSFYADYDDVQ